MTDNYRREILNAIDKKERELTGLRLRLSQTPEGHMSKAKKFLDSRIMGSSYQRFGYEVVDSCHDQTVGVLFKPYFTYLNNVSIFRTPVISTINEIFSGSIYTIRDIYATPKGLVVEIHEN